MRILVLMAIMLPVPVFADIVTPPHAASRVCGRDDRIMPAGVTHDPGFQRLDRLPPAAAYLTVYRSVDGCPAPVIIRYNIGAPTPRR